MMKPATRAKLLAASTIEDITALAVQAFLEDSEEQILDIDRMILELEQSGDAAADAAPTVDELFRLFHTIKGSGDCVGFGNLARFTHGCENMLADVRSGQAPLTHEILSGLLHRTEQIRQRLAMIQADGSDNFDFATTPDEGTPEPAWIAEQADVRTPDVLLVLQSRTIGLIVNNRIKALGFTGSVAIGPEQALGYVLTNWPDVVIVSATRDTVGGVDLLRAIMALYGKRPILPALPTSNTGDNPDLQRLPESARVLRIDEEFDERLGALIAAFYVDGRDGSA